MSDKTQSYISMNRMAVELGVSVATVRNWIRLGKISPDLEENGIYYFSEEMLSNIVNRIFSDSNNVLKSRRNKKYIKGFNLYKSYLSRNSENIKPVEDLIRIIINKNIKLDKSSIKLILAECGIQLIIQRKNIQTKSDKNYLYEYLTSRLEIGSYNKIVEDFIDDKENGLRFIKTYPELFEQKYTYEESEDILGFIYQSCEKISNKKSKGAYYTPTNIVKNLISRLDLRNLSDNDRILDPCCGGGNFLLQLPLNININQIYGNDTDFISICITRLNLALKYNLDSLNVVYKNFTNKNYLFDYNMEGFNYIIGNPPWGYEFSTEELGFLKNSYQVASNKTESYEVFIEKSLQLLNKNGIVSFVLPESILNIRTHKKIRQFIKKANSIKYIEFLGDIFDNVQCPSVILEILHNNKQFSYINSTVKILDKTFIIKKERDTSKDNFLFNMTDEEYELIEKITTPENKVFLKNNSIFALGIVTGDNKLLLQSEKTEFNEPIIKGNEIVKYKVLNPKNYIEFHPKEFQQVAPTEYYRASEKLLYRFISKELIFAYDNKQRLSLNSCNIVIPLFKDLDIKYILAVLNSRISQFLFNKTQNSIKVLRSHIEEIPIPRCDKTIQKEIIKLVDKLIAEDINKNTIYTQIDKLLLPLFGLSERDYRIISSSSFVI